MELSYAFERQSLENDTYPNPKRRSAPNRRGEGQTRAGEQEELVGCQVPTLPPCTGSTARDPPDFSQSCDGLSDSCSQEMHRGFCFSHRQLPCEHTLQSQLCHKLHRGSLAREVEREVPFVKLIPPACPRNTEIYCSRNKCEQKHTYFRLFSLLARGSRSQC